MNPAPVTLFTSEPGLPATEAAAGSGWAVVLWVVAVLTVVGVSAAVSVLAWRGRWRDPPCARAAAALCKSLGVRPEGTAMLDRLATALGAEPVALLLCESAFERGIRAIEDESGPLEPRDKAALLALRAAVFGGSGEAGRNPGQAAPTVGLAA